MDTLVALPDGTVLPPSAPLLQGDDPGVLYGHGVFETTLVVDGVPRDFDEHLTRLTVSAQACELDAPSAPSWLPAVGALLDDWSGGREMVLRLVITGGGVCYATGSELPAASLAQRTAGVGVLLLDRGFSAEAARRAPWLLTGAKTLSYGMNLAALRHARAAGADDVIFIATDESSPADVGAVAADTVLESPTASVVIAQGRTLLTPPPVGILKGITVRRLLRTAAEAGWQVRTSALTTADLATADGVWMTSSARLLAPVVAIDGVARGDGGLTAELARLLGVPQTG